MTRWSVLGAGVSGLCAATALAEAGAVVEVITSAAHAAASRLAGGMLAPRCEAECAPAGYTGMVADGFRALAWWQAHTRQVQVRGTLVLAPARDQSLLARFAARTGGHRDVLPDELEPGLEGRFARGLYFPDEGHLEPAKALDELIRRLRERGVPVHAGKPVGKVVDCRGIAARDRLPDLRAVRGEMVELGTTEVHFARPLRLLHPRYPCYLVPRGDGRFMLGASMLESDSTAPVSVRSLLELLSSACAIHPAFAEASVLRTGTGLRPAFPGNLPEVRYRDGRFYINGMFRHGFLLAPVMAQRLVAMLDHPEVKHGT